jgi:hypothetical protein
MIYQEIKDQKQRDYNKLFDTCGVFWAFSDKQWEENKTEKLPDEKYVSIGGGGYLPKHNVEKLMQGTKAIDETFKQQIQEFKAREQHILYELNNYECYYTGDITEALEAMGNDYTTEEVQAVFKKFKAQKYLRETTEADYLPANA